MGQISDSYKPVTATVLSQSYGGDKQLLWVEPSQTDPEAVGWLHSSWLDGYAYSTLPVKGEESLDLQSPLTTSPNLDNFISTAPAEQRLDDDDRHGYLTGSCGRHAKRRGTAAIQVCSCHHLHPAPTGCPFESGCTVLLLHQGRSSFHIATVSHVLQHHSSYL